MVVDGRAKPLSPRSLLPASSSPRPRTTSDVVAAPRETHGARTIGLGSKLDARSHGTDLNERARVSRSSLTNDDAPCSGIGPARAMSDYEAPGRLGTRMTQLSTRRSTVESRGAHDVEHGSRLGSGSSPVAQQRRRTSCEDRAKRPREKTSLREGLQRPSTTDSVAGTVP